MKKRLIASLASLLVVSMASAAFAGSISLANYSNKAVGLGYTVQYANNETKQSTMYNIPHESPTVVTFQGDKAYQVNSLYNKQDGSSIECSGLALNQFFSTVSVTVNADGSCSAVTSN